MKRSKLEAYLGKQVEITLFNGTCYTGYLHKTQGSETKNIPAFAWKYNYYALSDKDVTQTLSGFFRCSHVVSCKELK